MCSAFLHIGLAGGDGGLCIAALGGGDRGGSSRMTSRLVRRMALGWRRRFLCVAGISPRTERRWSSREMDKKVLGLAVTDGKCCWETAFVAGARLQRRHADGGWQHFDMAVRSAFDGGEDHEGGDAFVAKQLWQNAEATLQFNTPVLKDGTLLDLAANNDFRNHKDGKTRVAPLASPTNAMAANPNLRKPPAVEPTWNERTGRRAWIGRRATWWSWSGARRSGWTRVAGGRLRATVDAGSVLLALTPASELVAFQPSEKAHRSRADQGFQSPTIRVSGGFGQTHLCEGQR